MQYKISFIMPSCSIKTCKNTSRNKKNVRYFSFPKNQEMIAKWKIFCKENVNPNNARICSQHFHFSQYKDRSWLLGLLPNYSPVKSRKLKPDAIPMEFVEDNATTVVEKDLKTEVIECTHVATDCVASSSESFVISMLANEVALSFTNEEASCSVTQVASSSETRDTPSSANPVASCSTSTSSDNFSLTQVSFNQDDIQKLIRENADLVHQNEILQNKVLQLDQINKLHEKEMKNINKGHEQEMKNKLQEMLSPFFTPGQVKLLMNPTQKITRWSSEDIAAAISLRSVSPKAYRYLRKTKKIPLPALTSD